MLFKPLKRSWRVVSGHSCRRIGCCVAYHFGTAHLTILHVGVDALWVVAQSVILEVLGRRAVERIVHCSSVKGVTGFKTCAGR